MSQADASETFKRVREPQTCRAVLLGIALSISAPCSYGATRAEYAAMIQREADAISKRHLVWARRWAASAAAVGRGSVDYALMEAFLARYHAQTERAARAKEVLLAVNKCVLEGKEPARIEQFSQMQFCLYHTLLLYTWLKELNELDAPTIQRTEAMLKACADGVVEHVGERGAMNRVACQGLGTAAVARLFPHAPNVSRWLDYSEAAWNDWWSFRDTIEDSSGYNKLWLWAVILQGEQLGKSDELRGPDVQELISRMASQCSPLGPIPDYGDSYWAGDWARWVAIFEWGAAAFDRPDFRQAADAIFRYAEEQEARNGSSANLGAIGLISASRWMREDLEPRAAATKSLVTKRQDPYGRTLFDKMVLRAGLRQQDAYVLVNLFDGGYHGHCDSGALCAFVGGGSVLLHELGYEQRTEQFHNTLLIRPIDEDFLSLDQLFQAQRWYTTCADFQRAFRFGPRPDLKNVTALYFRIDDVDEINAQFDFNVERIEGIDEHGRAVPLIDLSSPGECEKWHGHRPPAPPAVQGGLCIPVAFRDPKKSETVWSRREFDPPIDLTAYDRLHIRWRSGDARVDPKWGIELGVDTAAGTLRFPFSHHLTYRKTTNAQVEDFERVVYARLAQSAVDCLGRPFTHMRELALTKEAMLLCMYDTVRFDTAGEYAVGPVWHVQRVLASSKDGFLCRDDYQWDDSRENAPSIRWASPPKPLWIELAGPPGVELKLVEKAFTDRDRTVPQRNHLYARWAGTVHDGETVGLLSVILPMPPEATTPPGDVTATITSDGAIVQKEDIRLLFRQAASQDCTSGEKRARFLYLEGKTDQPRYSVGIREDGFTYERRSERR